MKFESFAVTSVGNSNKVNRENFFLNGICKDDVKRREAIGENLAFGKRDLYAVADGSESAAFGEEAAFTVVNILREFLGSDFRNTYETFFEVANNDIAGRIFENNQKKEYADMAILYIKGSRARVYNIGEGSVFIYRGDKLKKLSGKVLDTVTVEESRLDEEDNVIIEPVTKKTARLLGAETDECALCPYISGDTKIAKNDIFILCNKGVTENVSKESIKRILSDKKRKISEKVSAIVQEAIDSGCKSEATVALVCAKGGHSFSWVRSKLFAGIVVLMIMALIAIASKEFIYDAAKYVHKLYTRYDEVKADTEEVPWSPIDIGEYDDDTPEVPEEVAEVPEDTASVAEAAADTQTVVNDTRPKPSTGGTGNKPVVQKPPESSTEQVSEPAASQPAASESTTPEPPVNKQEERPASGGVELPMDFTGN